MDLEDIKRKMKGLMAHAAAVGPESENAKRIMANLIEKYKLNPEEFSNEKKWITYKTHRLKRYGLSLALFCKVTTSIVPGRPDYIAIHADSLEYKMFHELLGEVKHQFNKKERELMKMVELEGKSLDWKNDALKSFMVGFMKANFPYDAKLCTMCKKGTIGAPDKDNIGVCSSCGTKYSYGKTRFGGISNADEYNKGLSTNRKSINHNKLLLS